jgi:WD40 repeat protein
MRALAISSDGRTLATGGEANTVDYWELADGKPRLKHEIRH